MKWRKHDGSAIVSEDGRYSVSKIGNRLGHFYEAWQTRKHEDGSHLIATCLQTAKEAQAIVEAHDATHATDD